MIHACTRCQLQNLKLWPGSLDEASTQHQSLEMLRAYQHGLIPLHTRVLRDIADMWEMFE